MYPSFVCSKFTVTFDDRGQGRFFLQQEQWEPLDIELLEVSSWENYSQVVGFVRLCGRPAPNLTAPHPCSVVLELHVPLPPTPFLPQKRQAAQRAAEEEAAAAQAAAAPPPPPADALPGSPRASRAARAAAVPGAYARFYDEGPGGDFQWEGLGSGQAAAAAAGVAGGAVPPASPRPRSADQLPQPLPLSPEGQRNFKAQVWAGGCGGEHGIGRMS